MPEFFNYLRQRDWPVLFGYLLFIGMMATGYYYNLTFVQLGLVDLATRLVGMNEADVAWNMAALALITCLVAVMFGLLMCRRGWGEEFVLKLRIAFGVVVAQTLLTVAAPFIRSELLFFIWIVAASSALGVGVPTTFSLVVDLVPRQDRGYVAALITAGAYFAAAVFSTVWQVERFAAQALIALCQALRRWGYWHSSASPSLPTWPPSTPDQSSPLAASLALQLRGNPASSVSWQCSSY